MEIFLSSGTAAGFWQLATGCSETEGNLETGIRNLETRGRRMEKGNLRLEEGNKNMTGVRAAKASSQLPATSREYVQLKPVASCQPPVASN